MATAELPKKSDVQDERPTWAIVELMGHAKAAGRLTEEEKFGAKLGRLDIPVRPRPGCQACGGTGTVSADRPGQCPICPAFRTLYFGGQSVCRVQVVTEAVARHVGVASADPASYWDFPEALLPAGHLASAGHSEDDEPDAWSADDDDAS